MNSFINTFLPITRDLLTGFQTTVKLFALTLLFSLPLGLLISFGSMSKFSPLRLLIRTFVWIIRGTPLMLQLIVIYYGPGLIFDLPLMDRFLAALVAFV
ncbi:MAG TPA: polar amino acid ABC transporter permease, partial [Clostridiales bacterium]|nr:polar amino acid ABC transporter permease [Clostridiales bacterium]